MPTSSSEPTRPVTSAQPLLGSVIRESTFSSVLLPAPLCPIRPIASPRLTVKETSRSASRVVELDLGPPPDQLLGHRLDGVDEAVAQGPVALVAEPEPEALAEVVHLDRDVTHQMMSAKLRSTRSK